MRVGGAYVVLAVLCAHASATSTAGLRGGAEEHQAVTRRLFGGMLGALLGKPGDEASEVAAGLYQELLDSGVEAILDDRKERPGVKFNDAELIGYPLQIVVGSRGLAEGVVEFKDRAAGSKDSVETGAVVELATTRVKEARA